MFEKIMNYKATGVCQNNIANYHFKNGKFELAQEIFNKAIVEAEKGLIMSTLKLDFSKDKKTDEELYAEKVIKEASAPTTPTRSVSQMNFLCVVRPVANRYREDTA